MPAQYIPAAQEQQNNSSETLQLLLLLKRQALEQKIAEHRLNVLGPLEDEIAHTNLDIAKFNLQDMKSTAPIKKQREEVGLRRDVATAQSAEVEAQNLPSLLTQQARGNEARIASEQSQMESARTSRAATEQAMSQRSQMFPVEQQSAQIAQDATRQQIATSKEQMQTAISSRENQKKELSLQKQQLVLHAAQSKEGIMLLKNHPDFAKDPEMAAYIRILPDDVDPKSTDEFRARSLHNLMLSNDPLLANLKYTVIQGLADSMGNGRGDKTQALMEALGASGATDAAKSDLVNAVGQAYKQTKIQGPPDGNMQGDVVGETTLKKGELGPEQTTGAVVTPVNQVEKELQNVEVRKQHEKVVAQHVKYFNEFKKQVTMPQFGGSEGESATEQFDTSQPPDFMKDGYKKYKAKDVKLIFASIDPADATKSQVQSMHFLLEKLLQTDDTLAVKEAFIQSGGTLSDKQKQALNRLASLYKWE